MAEERLPEVRVGDAERQAVVDRLNAALGEGRIDLSEFDERSGRAYAARTQAELEPLTADLPVSPPPPPAGRPRPDREARREARGTGARPAAADALRRRLTPDELRWLGTSIVLVAIWLVTCVASGRLLYFWPVFPVGIWGAILLARRVTRS